MPFWGPDPPPLAHPRLARQKIHLSGGATPWTLAFGSWPRSAPRNLLLHFAFFIPLSPHSIPGEPLTCPVQMMLRLTGFLLLLLPSPTSPRAAERAPGRAHNPNGKFLECDVIVLGKRFPVSPGKSDPFWQPGRRKTRFVLQILSPSRRDTPRI